jgi:hypothetical protein
MMSGTDGMRIDSNFEVRWAGWRTTLFDLQHCGWVVSMNQDHCRAECHFRLRHEVLELVAVSDMFRYDYSRPDQAPIHVNWIASIKHLNVNIPSSFVECRSFDIDASPKAMAERMYNNEHWDGNLQSLFGIKQQEQVFIEQADLSVLDHLQAIKDKQADKQGEIRQRILLNASRNERPVNSLELIHAA